MFGIEGEPYRILGDDIVIRNDTLANKYKKILGSLGIPFSKAKTMQSKTTFEFAKRWFHNGVEVTPFPTNAIHESLTSIAMLVETFRTAEERGWDQNVKSGPVLVRSMLKAHDAHKIFIKKALNDYALITSFPRRHLSNAENHENWVKFLRLAGHYVSCVG